MLDELHRADDVGFGSGRVASHRSPIDTRAVDDAIVAAEAALFSTYANELRELTDAELRFMSAAAEIGPGPYGLGDLDRIERLSDEHEVPTLGLALVRLRHKEIIYTDESYTAAGLAHVRIADYVKTLPHKSEPDQRTAPGAPRGPMRRRGRNT
jgi:hypothetical protein